MVNKIMQIYYIFKLYSELKYIDNLVEVNDKVIYNIKYYIEKIGVFTIKLSQWLFQQLEITSNNKGLLSIIEKLDCYFENCKIHDFRYTKQFYKNDFNRNLEDDYELSNIPIASGSIGQVYYGIDKITNEKIAIKCIHPHIHDEIVIPKYLSILLNKFFHIPLNLDNFFNNMENQMDMIKEVKNIEKMRKYYESNKYIIIPRVYKYSKNIIIMSYEEGESWLNFKGSKYQKQKIATLVKLFTLSNIKVNGFSHGDLHLGNWRIHKDKIKNLNKIIIYDLGLCYNIDTDYTLNFFNAIDNENYNDILNYLFSSYAIYKNPLNEKKTKELKEIILNEITNKFNINKITLNDIQKLIPKISKEGIIFNEVFINLFLSFMIISRYTINLCENVKDYNNKKLLTNSKYTVIFPALISFCETYDIFDELKNIFKNKIDIFYKNNKPELFNNIDLRIENLKNK